MTTTLTGNNEAQPPGFCRPALRCAGCDQPDKFRDSMNSLHPGRRFDTWDYDEERWTHGRVCVDCERNWRAEWVATNGYVPPNCPTRASDRDAINREAFHPDEQEFFDGDVRAVPTRAVDGPKCAFAEQIRFAVENKIAASHRRTRGKCGQRRWWRSRVLSGPGRPELDSLQAL